MLAEWFRELKPDQIAAYLKARDWREVGVDPDHAEQWALWSCPFHDPAHRAYTPKPGPWWSDWLYGQKVIGALDHIAECEGRPSPALQLYRDMQGFTSDKVHYAISIEPGVQFGDPVIAGTRIQPEIIAGYYWVEGLDRTRLDYPGIVRGQVLVAAWYCATRGGKAWRRRWGQWAKDNWDALWRAEYERCELPPWNGDTSPDATDARRLRDEAAGDCRPDARYGHSEG